MITTAPFEILSVEVTNASNDALTYYKGGSTLKLIFSLKNNTIYSSHAYYSYYFGYKDNTNSFVQYSSEKYEGIRTDDEVGPVAGDGSDTLTLALEYTIPNDVPARSTYCFKIIVAPDTYNISPMDYEVWEDVKYSPIFRSEPSTGDSSECLLYAYAFQTTQLVRCWIDPSENTVTQIVPFGTSLSAKTPMFAISLGATASISSVDQTSGVSVVDLSAPKVYRITAEDGVTYRDYTVTITVGPAISGGLRPNLVLYHPGGCTEETVYIGEVARLYCSIGNMAGLTYSEYFSTTEPLYDYQGTEGAIVYVEYYHPVNLEWVMLPEANFVVNRFIGQKAYVTGDNNPIISYVTITGSWKVSDKILYGSTYGTAQMRMKLAGKSQTITFSVEIKRKEYYIKTLSYSEKLNVFQGERDYNTISWLRLKNRLYAASALEKPDEDTLNVQPTFFLQDVDNENSLFDKTGSDILTWSVSFYVNHPVAQAIFQSVAIEAANHMGEGAEIKSIEYMNKTYYVKQEPFSDGRSYDYTGISFSWENPWEPQWKKDKWYLSIKNAVDESQVIQNQKLKGVWLRVKINGVGGDKILLRSVLTKIANLFN